MFRVLIQEWLLPGHDAEVFGSLEAEGTVNVALTLIVLGRSICVCPPMASAAAETWGGEGEGRKQIRFSVSFLILPFT